MWLTWREVMKEIGGNNMFAFDEFMHRQQVPIDLDGNPVFHKDEVEKFKNSQRVK